MDVSDVLRDRMHESGGASQLAAMSVSALAHATLVAVILFSPKSWMSSPAPEARNVMTINLMGGGPRGADTGGFVSTPTKVVGQR